MSCSLNYHRFDNDILLVQIYVSDVLISNNLIYLKEIFEIDDVIFCSNNSLNDEFLGGGFTKKIES